MCGFFCFKEKVLYICNASKNLIIMTRLTEEQINNEWVKFYSTFEKLGLSKFYDMDKLKSEISASPCTTTEDAGTAYEGALLIHINMLSGVAQRLAKMISGTFSIDENSLLKVCYLMHLAKRHMYIKNENEWEIKNRGMNFKFNELEGCLRCGERSALEALNNGVSITPTEFEAITSLDNMEDTIRNPYNSILTLVVRQANELAYAIEKERFRKISEQKQQ